ncbi:MAG: glycosyltransferase family 4 protein [Desulfobulbaceae bacterium]|nr:glycosyltransferase family 4 protein [Desulfobulbaceae bacterium]MDY0350823.1 glycosyltransferase family 4 protein [Desulfobulbaceae bacterium]
MRTLKVIHIAPTPFFADRGCHIRIRNEIYSLRGQSVRIILCTYHHGKGVEGIDIRRIPRIPGYNKLEAGYSPFRFIADTFLFLLVLWTVWRERPDILHAHLHEGALIGWSVRILLFWRRLPLIMDMQGSLAGELAAYGAFRSFPAVLKLFHHIERIICRLPDFFFCSSEASCRLLVRDFGIKPDKVRLLQDVVPDDFFTERDRDLWKRKFHIPGAKKILLYTGSLLPGKGIHHVWEAMRILSSRRHDLFWLLVGYPLEDTRDFIRENSLENICLLPGQVRYDELPFWLAVADLALEPKSDDAGEASGKILHYMAAGLPIVCFPTDNNRRILSDTGFFAETLTPEAYIAAVAKALDSPDDALQKGRRNRELARTNHSMAAVQQKLMDRYSTLAAKGR